MYCDVLQSIACRRLHMLGRPESVVQRRNMPLLACLGVVTPAVMLDCNTTGCDISLQHSAVF